MSSNWREELKAAVLAEMNEGPLAHRLHYSKGTYADGCRGPMCRKAERDETKARQERKFRKSGLPYRPQVDDEETCLRDDMLNDIIYRYRHNKGRSIIPRRPVYPADWFQMAQ